jgi:predicted secreted hydrolase
MFYRLRRADGTSDPHSGGSVRSPSGEVATLRAHDVELEARRTWLSPSSGVEYPVAWRLVLDEQALVLDITPYLDQQEVDLAVRYWEGAVRVEGRGPAGNVDGRGYVELAGY